VESLEARGWPTKRGATPRALEPGEWQKDENDHMDHIEEMDEKGQFNGVKASSRIRHPRVTFRRYLGIEPSPESPPVIPSFGSEGVVHQNSRRPPRVETSLKGKASYDEKILREHDADPFDGNSACPMRLGL
jgi:hypothetical protein